MPRLGGPKKEKKVTFVCEEEELEMLRDLAAADGRTASDWLRRAIRNANAAQQQAAPPKKSKR